MPPINIARIMVAAFAATAFATACTGDPRPREPAPTTLPPVENVPRWLPQVLAEDGYISPEEAEALKDAFGLPEKATQLEVIEALTNENRALRVANEAERYARRHAPRTLGGIYLDHVGPIVFTRVGFTEAVRRHAVALRGFVSHPELIRVFTARNPRWKLKELSRTISFADWRARGIRITSVGVNEASGVVEIGVQDLTEEKRAALEAAYGADFIRVADEDPAVALPG